MVCPSCARMHGQEHHEGCPEGFPPGSWLGEYLEGWDAAKNALLPPFVDELERQGEALMASMIALAKVEWQGFDASENGDVCPACGAEKTDGHKDGCAVAKAIDKVRELIAR